MMNSYKIKYSKEFKKSFKKIVKQGKNIDKLLNVVDMLSRKQLLDQNIKTMPYIMIKDLKIVEAVILNRTGCLFINI